MTEGIKIPVWFWAIAILALIWNALGVMAYVMDVTMTPEMMAALPEAKQNLYAARPSWVTSAFAISVFMGLFGSIALLLKKKIATSLFVISFVAVLTQNSWMFLMSDLIAVMGGQAAIFPLIIIAVCIFLIWFAKTSTAKGWLS